MSMTREEIINNHLSCICDKMYKSRNMIDPECFKCEYETEIMLMMDEYTSDLREENEELRNKSNGWEFLYNKEKAISGERKECIRQVDLENDILKKRIEELEEQLKNSIPKHAIG